ncbi:MAG: nuclear transport factor 2 family protein [Acidimicrobiia bacterium]|nr:nuclear transport factor 2 family protein [Acidimicrobiia bacterium]
MGRTKQESRIRRLLAEYCQHYDDGRPEEFADLFAEDGAFTVFGETRRGRREIHDTIGQRRPGMPPGQHVTYNTVLDVDDDGRRARARTDFLYLTKTDGGFSVSQAGRYYDDLVREEDRWRFRSRTIRFLGEPEPEG